MKKWVLSIIASVSITTLPLSTWAEDSTNSFSAAYWSIVLLAIAIVLIAVLVLLILVQVLIGLQHLLNEKTTEKFSIWEYIWGLNPLAKEKEMLLEEEFDGIRELNNPTPVWFNLLFGGTIAFGAIYMIIYHVTKNADLQEAEYVKEVAIAEIKQQEYLKKMAGSINENNVKLVQDAKSLENGSKLYQQYCAACHGSAGEGKVGPNLTDEYWLHGGSVVNIFKTIKYGVPEKGMIAWQKQLNPLQMQQIASYILSLQGTNPANAKEPQGEKVSPAADKQTENTAQLDAEKTISLNQPKNIP